MMNEKKKKNLKDTLKLAEICVKCNLPSDLNGVFYVLNDGYDRDYPISELGRIVCVEGDFTILMAITDRGMCIKRILTNRILPTDGYPQYKLFSDEADFCKIVCNVFEQEPDSETIEKFKEILLSVNKSSESVIPTVKNKTSYC